MIGRLRGELVVKKPPYLLLEVGGVGYEIQSPMSTIYQLPPLGTEVTLLIHFHVREDLQVLYGFYQEQERILFKTLIKISGVGPKMALGILSGMSVTEFVNCIHQRSVQPLMRLPGIGRKTAERLLIEMTDKLSGAFKDEEVSCVSLNSSSTSVFSPKEEAIAALIALGYKPGEATKVIHAIATNEEVQTETLIRRALQQLARC